MIYNVNKLIYNAIYGGAVMKVISAASGSVGKRDFSVHFPNGRGYYLYVHFRSKTMIYVDGEYIPVQAGTGIFYDKNQFQSYYGCGETEFNHDYVFFDLDNEIEENVFSNIPLGKPMFHVNSEYITNIISLIEQEKYLPSQNAEDILSLLGLAFLYKAGEKINDLSAHNNRRYNQYEAFYRLRDDIYKKPTLDWSIEYAANKLFLSKFYFQSLYKQFFKTTFQKDIICARISSAKKLLLYSDNKIYEIAEMCGYKNVEHFTRQFRRQVGVTPREFKNQMFEKARL